MATATPTSDRTSIAQPSAQENSVPQVTVELVIPTETEVAVVKIDVQGYEEHAMRGMEQILSHKKGFP